VALGRCQERGHRACRHDIEPLATVTLQWLRAEDQLELSNGATSQLPCRRYELAGPGCSAEGLAAAWSLLLFDEPEDVMSYEVVGTFTDVSGKLVVHEDHLAGEVQQGKPERSS